MQRFILFGIPLNGNIAPLLQAKKKKGRINVLPYCLNEVSTTALSTNVSANRSISIR
jgi:hypothetical protein